MRRAASSTVEWSATDSPAHPVIRMPRQELGLDHLRPFAIRGPGLAVALPGLVTKWPPANPSIQRSQTSAPLI